MPAPKGRSKSAKKPSPLDLLKEEIGKKQQCIEELSNQVNVDETYLREMIHSMVDDLRSRQSQKSLIEQRIEELEQRVTEQNDNYQVIVRKNLTCMNGIAEALQSSSPHEIKFLLRRIKQDLLLEEPIKRPVTAPAERSQFFSMTQLPPAPHESPLGNLQREYLKAMETVSYPQYHPVRKLPGDTHVKHLLPEIKQVVIDELRGDWRQFAHLVGISTETIQFWRRLECKRPMQQVMSYWKDSQAADVRTLHRILLSEQVKAVNLAKLVADFYYVD
ncbi:hypothetical protein EB796_014308 [Bugula neritina]|uniref:Death domain-containing protein n=1 Tax=Bugula neritina TaxID=10212 RepID=A0A7J7JMR7_BUGNE|nr:hypothetical protein EB796_014308 [Bugula neritina]